MWGQLGTSLGEKDKTGSLLDFIQSIKEED
jgi:hypothetical protein